MRTLNVISLDWDYFLNISSEIRAICFPDGGNENLPDFIKDNIWGSHYASSKELKAIKSDTSSIKLVKKVLKQGQFMACVTNSHKNAYDFIVNAVNKTDFLNLVNVDYHHDAYNKNSAVDCGNWLGHIMREYKGNYTWVSREDSDEPRKNIGLQRVTDLSIIEKFHWDLVFICKSDMWMPPHLDPDFKKAFECVLHQCASSCFVEDGVFKSRYSKEFQNGVEEQIKMYRHLALQMQGR